MKLTTYQDNGGRYHWALLSGEGVTLARSAATFVTFDEARDAALAVHDHAGSIIMEAS